MTEFEKWSEKYKNNGCTKDNLKDLVELGVITYTEYVQITGEEIAYTIEELKTKKVAYISGYKHKYVEWIPYDNHMQRCLNEDLIKIQGAERQMLSNPTLQLYWYYPDTRVLVTTAKYFTDMINMITYCTQVAYNVAYDMISEVNAMTIEQLKTYNVEARFDELYKLAIK